MVGRLVAEAVGHDQSLVDRLQMSAYKPSGLSGGSLSWFQWLKVAEYFYSPLAGWDASPS